MEVFSQEEVPLELLASARVAEEVLDLEILFQEMVEWVGVEEVEALEEELLEVLGRLG